MKPTHWSQATYCMACIQEMAWLQEQADRNPTDLANVDG